MLNYALQSGRSVRPWLLLLLSQPEQARAHESRGLGLAAIAPGHTAVLSMAKTVEVRAPRRHGWQNLLEFASPTWARSEERVRFHGRTQRAHRARDGAARCDGEPRVAVQDQSRPYAGGTLPYRRRGHRQRCWGGGGSGGWRGDGRGRRWAWVALGGRDVGRRAAADATQRLRHGSALSKIPLQDPPATARPGRPAPCKCLHDPADSRAARAQHTVRAACRRRRAPKWRRKAPRTPATARRPSTTAQQRVVRCVCWPSVPTACAIVGERGLRGSRRSASRQAFSCCAALAAWERAWNSPRDMANVRPLAPASMPVMGARRLGSTTATAIQTS